MTHDIPKPRNSISAAEADLRKAEEALALSSAELEIVEMQIAQHFEPQVASHFDDLRGRLFLIEKVGDDTLVLKTADSKARPLIAVIQAERWGDEDAEINLMKEVSDLARSLLKTDLCPVGWKRSHEEAVSNANAAQICRNVLKSRLMEMRELRRLQQVYGEIS